MENIKISKSLELAKEILEKEVNVEFNEMKKKWFRDR